MENLASRILDKILPEPNSGCWLWVGALSNTGYGSLGIGNKKTASAHRYIYEQLVGKIPTGLQLDHLCKTRCCVNPDHLEPVTNKENSNRGDTGKHMTERAKHTDKCKHGHSYCEKNTRYRIKRGYKYRVCRTCHRLSNKK